MMFNKPKLFTIILFCIMSTVLLAQRTVTDIDGNVYNTVTIGTQIWMVENLKVTHYRNKEPIPIVSDHMKWSFLESGACCDYDNSFFNCEAYGKLYNYYAIVDDRRLCPDGWHIPTDKEWSELTYYLGEKSNAAGKLKEETTDYWQSPNTEANNASCFTALPGGNRASDGSFAHLGSGGYWWSSSKFGTNDAWSRYIFYNSGNVYRYDGNIGSAFSVRCLKN